MIKTIKPFVLLLLAGTLVACAPNDCAPTEDEVKEPDKDSDKEIVNIYVDYGVEYEEVDRDMDNKDNLED